MRPEAVGVLHMGALHPMEQALTLGLAFGPFLVLGVVVAVRRRQDRLGGEMDDASDAGDPGDPGRLDVPDER